MPHDELVMAEKLLKALHNCEIALYQLDKIAVFIVSCMLAGVVLYSIYYILIRFTKF